MSEIFKPMNAVELREMNQQAIKDGYLLPNEAPFSHDGAKDLGKKELTSTDDRCLRIITEGTASGFVSTDTILKQLLHLEKDSSILPDDPHIVWNIIARIKNKLGKMSIVNKFGVGYVSRRQYYVLAVERNKKKLVVSPEGIEPSFRV